MAKDKSMWGKYLAYFGLLLLAIDLVTYYNQIVLYFTTLGIVLLVVSFIVILVGVMMS